jgi:hypothetical protein
MGSIREALRRKILRAVVRVAMVGRILGGFII